MRAPQRIAVPALLLALVALGCTGRVVPQSAQAGSTVVIPLGARSRIGPVGFGGTAVDDPQRGQLVYRLRTPSGSFALETRGSALVTGHAASDIAQGSFVTHQVVSLVDVPADAPLGTHPLDVFRLRIDPASGEVLWQEIGYEGELSVLPSELPVSGPRGPETIVGETTPFEHLVCGMDGCSWHELGPELIAQAIPDPVLRVRVDDPVSALELRVEYPASVIDIVDSFESPLQRVSHRAATWRREPSAGVLRVGAAAERSGFDALSLAFVLDEPDGPRLDPASVSVSVEGAWDHEGRALQRRASIEGVF